MGGIAPFSTPPEIISPKGTVCRNPFVTIISLRCFSWGEGFGCVADGNEGTSVSFLRNRKVPAAVMRRAMPIRITAGFVFIGSCNSGAKGE